MAVSVVSLEKKQFSKNETAHNQNAKPFICALQRDEHTKRMNNILVECIKRRDVVGALAALKKGADVNARDQFSRTALMLAVITDQTELAEFLVKAGASVNASDDFGQTPLMWASLSGNTHLVKFLLENGANVKAVDIHGCDALMMSVHGNKKIAQILIEAGAEPRHTDTYGRSAIDHAKQMKKTEIAELLSNYCYSQG